VLCVQVAGERGVSDIVSKEKGTDGVGEKKKKKTGGKKKK
jgi:hypothetical protein